MTACVCVSDGVGTAVDIDRDADDDGGERAGQVSPVLAPAVRDGGHGCSARHVREGGGVAVLRFQGFQPDGRGFQG